MYIFLYKLMPFFDSSIRFQWWCGDGGWVNGWRLVVRVHFPSHSDATCAAQWASSCNGIVLRVTFACIFIFFSIGFRLQSIWVTSTCCCSNHGTRFNVKLFRTLTISDLLYFSRRIKHKMRMSLKRDRLCHRAILELKQNERERDRRQRTVLICCRVYFAWTI